MAEIIKMPRLSDTMEEGTVATWLKKVGDTIEEGDILAEIETDKATMEFESFNEGTLLFIGIQEGDTAPVDALLAIIGEKDEDVDALIKDFKTNSTATEEASEKEVIFVRGTTEAINLIAQTFGRANIGKNDEILITAMEHHSNIVPWQMLCQQTGAILKVAPINKRGELIYEEFEALISDKTKLVSVVHMSNALGTINPVKKIIAAAHAKNIPVLLDGAQAIPHMPVDVQNLDCDFYVFSGHKLYAPSGIGVLYGKQALLDAMPAYQGGGDMIRTVTFEKSTYSTLPYKFEAGTPNIADTVGLGAAIDYLNTIGMEAIAAYEYELLTYATAKARQINGLTIIGDAAEKGAILSFTLDKIHPHDIGTMLDSVGIAIRAGHHCAMPVMDFFNVPATARASFAMYNTKAEIDVLMEAIQELMTVFG